MPGFPFFVQGVRVCHIERRAEFGYLAVVNPGIQLFGTTHLLILAAIPAIAGALSWMVRMKRELAGLLRSNLAAFLLVNELIWYIYNVAEGWVHFPYGLPLDLCDVVVWLTIAAAFTGRPALVELAYYWGIAGSSMAVLTPDLGVPLVSYPGVYFFLAHGGVVITALFLVWGELARPRPGSMWKALFWLNVYAAAIGGFNAIFRTNYFYLCEKPASASLLDYMGPWPFYLLTGELFGLVVFYLLALPFRGSAKQSRP